MTIVERLWIGLKLVLSAMFVVAICAAIVQAAIDGALFNLKFLGSIFIFAAIASSMWFRFRAARVTGSFAVGAGSLYFAKQIFLGEDPMPFECAQYRSKLFCELINGVYDLGGVTLVALIYVTIAGLMFSGIFLLTHNKPPANKPRSEIPHVPPTPGRANDF